MIAKTLNIRAGTLLWVYRQYIAMPYIALARQQSFEKVPSSNVYGLSYH